MLNWPLHFSKLHDTAHPYDEALVYIWVVERSCIIVEWLFKIFLHHHNLLLPFFTTSNLHGPSSPIILSKMFFVNFYVIHFCTFQVFTVKCSHLHSNKATRNFSIKFTISLMVHKMVPHNNVLILA